MFKIKTFAKNLIYHNKKSKLSNDWLIQKLMQAFQADELGHQASHNKADLGYGWIHYGLIRQQKPKYLLCIGSRYGYIPAVMAQACKDNNYGKVDFVDAGYGDNDKNHWTGKGYWKTEKGLSSFKKFGLENFIKVYVQTTQNFKKQYLNKKYDYIYIDGDHSYQGVSFDAKTFWPKLNKNGYMIFHDVCVKSKQPEGEYGVYKFFNEFSKNKQHLKIDNLKSGLGVIQKK